MADRVVVVDDDIFIVKTASHILTEAGLKVSSLSNGADLLKFMEKNEADLILLDIRMPQMDGMETLKRLREYEKEAAKPETPVIFFSGDEDEDAETKCLSLGAMDFIRKPFGPEVLKLRIRHTIDLIRLQRDLMSEVDKKSKEVEKLSIHVVRTLAEAIDAKDTYTNGHSSRVADYSKEIAKRYGYDTKRQDAIYMMGLLHDVGKIGVPDAVINKPGRLNDEEYEMIKTHPVMGAKILSKIEEMPKLVTGARWHHERYDGKGYPDALKGDEIPEEARIIAVADSYDAMTSRRSYRDVLPQVRVRSEIEGGAGTQFDPKFAAIMLEIIDEDTEYKLHEK